MSRVLRPFAYTEPKTVEAATDALARHGPKAKVLAGGCDLVPGMLRREIQPDHVVSIGAIQGLDYIENNNDGLRFGALTSIRTMELYPGLGQEYGALYEAIRSIAKIQVKNSGTVVGNLCVASPASDIIPALMVLGAEIKVNGPGSQRAINIEDFCVGVKQSRLQEGELVTEVSVPKPSPGAGSVFLKLARTGADLAKVNTAVMMVVSAGTCTEIRIALGSVAPTPIRVQEAEQMLTGRKLDPKLVHEAAQAASCEALPVSDLRSTEDYRKQMVSVLVRRAIHTIAGL